MKAWGLLAGVCLAFGTACTSPGASGAGAGGAPCPAGQICMPPPNPGFQLQDVGDQIQPGQDVEYCEVVAIPGSPSDIYYVNRFEVQMTAFSHHLIVVAAVPGSDTEKAIKPGMKQLCTGATAFGEQVTGVTGSQHPYNDESYPPGVGKKFLGGQLLVFDYHYFNSSNDVVQAKAAVNFHTVDASQVQKTAHTFGFINVHFSVPPNSQGTTDLGCTFSHDLLVAKLIRHTHKWGADFDVWYQGGDHDGEHIWTTPSYEETDFPFTPPVLVKKGDGFKFRCAFNNTTTNTLAFGLKASNEMCILFGDWFVPNVGDDESEQGCIQ